jgi:hypothetical protein
VNTIMNNTTVCDFRLPSRGNGIFALRDVTHRRMVVPYRRFGTTVVNGQAAGCLTVDFARFFVCVPSN